MKDQQKRWAKLAEASLKEKGWSKTDLAIVAGVTPSAITQLFKKGKGSDDLKLLIHKKLKLSESWENLEEIS